ncbi:MAG: hypothetical protein WCV82_01600 [Candidatus Paceibacterota bacterium]
MTNKFESPQGSEEVVTNLGNIMDEAMGVKNNSEKPVTEKRTGPVEKVDRRRLKERAELKAYFDKMPQEQLVELALNAVVADPDLEAEIRKQAQALEGRYINGEKLESDETEQAA